MARKGVLRIIGELLHPVAQLRCVNVQILRCLRIRHASILDQAHSLKLELPRELSSLHDPPPAPSKHLTRCLRNRVQASGKNLHLRAMVQVELEYLPAWNLLPEARACPLLPAS